VLELTDGTVLHADESDALRAVLATGRRAPRVGSSAGSAPGGCPRSALTLLACACGWLYLSGIPRIAAWAAEQVSPQLEARIGAQLLAAMDRAALGRSHVALARQERIRARFAGLVQAAAPELQVRLEFRSERGGDGVNAFALPGRHHRPARRGGRAVG
jgi:hypothetical protein